MSFPLSEKADTDRGEGCQVRMRRRQLPGTVSLQYPGSMPGGSCIPDCNLQTRSGCSSRFENGAVLSPKHLPKFWLHKPGNLEDYLKWPIANLKFHFNICSVLNMYMDLCWILHKFFFFQILGKCVSPKDAHSLAHCYYPTLKGMYTLSHDKYFAVI